MTAPPLSAPAPPHYMGGILLRLLAMFSLAVMFVLVKLIAASGLHVVESMFWRQACALPFIIVWALSHGGYRSLATKRIGAHSRRMILGISGMACNFGAMIYLPMAEATTIGLSVPIFAVIFAALLLREPTGPARWSAVVVGFIGVLIVLNPVASLNGPLDSAHVTGTLIAIAGAVLTALVTIAIRDLGRTENATTTVFWFSLLSLIPLGIALPFFIQPHSGYQWILIIGLGLSGAISQIALTGALRLAPVAVVMPMDYSSLLWSIIFGWWIFSTIPAAATWVGAPVIVASGLFIAWREHRRQIIRTREIAL
jgi:drug/metabolite transporter (DMT)-like permease